MKRKIWVLLAVLVMLTWGIVGMAAEQPEVEGNIDFQVNGRIFKFKEYALGVDSDGEPAVILTFDYTNNSEESNYAFTDFSINIFQDGISRDSAYLGYKNEWTKELSNFTTAIRDGASLTVCHAFSLDNISSSIDVEVKETINWNETQKMTIDISKFSGKMPEAETEIEQLKTFESEYAEISENYATLESEYETLQSENEELKQAFEDLKKEEIEITDSTDWRSMYEDLSVEYETLQSEYDVLLEENGNFESELEYYKNSDTEKATEGETEISNIPETDEQENLFDESIETDIVFEEISPFFASKQNYDTIINNINSFKIEELKTAIGNYASTHQDDAVLLNAILTSLNEWGDFESLVCQTDSFSGETNIIFDSYTSIDAEHYIYPHYSNNEYKLRLGFVKDDWLFAEQIILKRASESMESAMSFQGDSFDFEREVIGGGKIMEYKEEDIYHTRIDKFLKDMDEEMVLRFQAKNGEVLDYTLTDTDKSALQNIAKYSKLVTDLSDIYDDNELYYTEISGNSIVSGKMSDKNSKNSFRFGVELINKESEYSTFKYYANFDFELVNNYEKAVSEISGIGTLLDAQGKQVISLRFNFADMEISPGEKLEKRMYYECKSYEEIYDISYEDLTLVYTPDSVTFSDGTIEEF